MIRELLRRLFGRAGGSSGKPAESSVQPEPGAGPRIDAARDRLKATIPPPGDQAPGGAVPPEGQPGGTGSGSADGGAA